VRISTLEVPGIFHPQPSVIVVAYDALLA